MHKKSDQYETLSNKPVRSDIHEFLNFNQSTIYIYKVWVYILWRISRGQMEPHYGTTQMEPHKAYPCTE